MLTHHQLGGMIGVSGGGIINYEKGLNPIYYEDAVKLGFALQIDPDELMDDYTRFCMHGYGVKIREIRRIYGLSQTDFAKKNGWSRATVSVWEKEIGNHHPSREAYQRLKLLAEEKGVRINDT